MIQLSKGWGFFSPFIFFPDTLSSDLVDNWPTISVEAPTAHRVLWIFNSFVHMRQASFCMLGTECRRESSETTGGCPSGLNYGLAPVVEGQGQLPLRGREPPPVPKQVLVLVGKVISQVSGYLTCTASCEEGRARAPFCRQECSAQRIRCLPGDTGNKGAVWAVSHDLGSGTSALSSWHLTCCHVCMCLAPPTLDILFC